MSGGDKFSKEIEYNILEWWHGGRGGGSFRQDGRGRSCSTCKSLLEVWPFYLRSSIITKRKPGYSVAGVPSRWIWEGSMVGGKKGKPV